MTYHDELVRAQVLLERVIDDLRAGRPEAEVAAGLSEMPRIELFKLRRLIDQQLARVAGPLAVEVIDGGLPLRDWLTDELEGDEQKARRMLAFIEEYGACSASLGREPTIPKLAHATGQSVATINRRLAEFRDVFAEERNPSRLARTLRRALDDQTLWETIDASIEATIGDVPIVPTTPSALRAARRRLARS